MRSVYNSALMEIDILYVVITREPCRQARIHPLPHLPRLQRELPELILLQENTSLLADFSLTPSPSTQDLSWPDEEEEPPLLLYLRTSLWSLKKFQKLNFKRQRTLGMCLYYSFCCNNPTSPKVMGDILTL